MTEPQKPLATVEQVRAHAEIAARALDLVERGSASAGHAIQLLIDHVADLRRGTDPGWGPVTVRLADVEPEVVEWLWPGRVPLGKVTIIDGDPGLGKSTLVLDLAARVSTGRSLPTSETWLRGGVVILTAEDGLGDTVRPRLQVAEADLDRVLALTTVCDRKGRRLPQLPGDLAHVRTAALDVDARLIIIDPLTAYLGAEIDAHRDAEVRQALAPLADLAATTGAAVLCVRHFNKSRGGSALHRGSGSIAFSGAARSVLAVGRDPNDPERRILASVKCNLAPPAESLGWELVSAGSVARIRWLGSSQVAADQLVDQQPVDDGRAIDRASELLEEVLADGPRPVSEVRRALAGSGIAWRTLQRARGALGVLLSRPGGVPTWRMPYHAS